MENFIEINAQGRFLRAGENTYELPANSADLYLRTVYFSEIWGDDHFFITGTPAEASTAPQGCNFAFTDNRDFLLSEKIAYNPKSSKGTPAQKTAREAFKFCHAATPDYFPTIVEIRSQQGPGKDLKLISGGGFVFVTHNFGEGPETRLALLQRTFKPLVLTDGNGLVAESYTAAKEALEETTLAVLDTDGSFCTFYAIDFAAPELADEDYVALKQEQKDLLLSNLAKEGIIPAAIRWERAGIREMTNLRKNTITLYDFNHIKIGSLTGIIGEEYDQNTLVCRRAGLWNAPNNAATVCLVDGELDRQGKILSQVEFSEKVALGTSVILSSTAGIGTYLFAQLPRPVYDVKTKPALRRPEDTV